MVSRAQPLEFVGRAKRDETLSAHRRIWRSLDGRYRVVESKSLFGLATVYYAMVRDELGWGIISRHRTKPAAVGACHRHWADAKAIPCTVFFRKKNDE